MTNKVFNEKYNIYTNLFFFTLAYLAIIDSFNGFLIKNYSISISSIYRLIMLAIFFYYANKGNKSYRNIYIYVVFIYMVTIGFINIIKFDEILGIKSELIGISKFLFIVVIIESFRNCVRDREEGIKLIEKIINYNLILFPMFLIVPTILNLGSNVYAGGLGSKGFFYSNNELSIVMSILFIFAIDKLYNNFNIKNLSVLLLVGITLLSIGSKTGMIIPMIISMIYLIRSFIDKDNKQKFRKFMIIAAIGSLVILIFICPNLIIEFINRQLYLYSIDGGSIVYAILSGRNEFLSIIYAYFIESNHKMMTLIFGYGEYVKNRIIASGLSSEYNPGVLKSIEMDFFDMLFGYGIIGIILVYGYFVETFVKNYSLKKERFKYTVAFISIMFLGFLSGHIFYSAMSGSMLAIVTCGLVFSNPNYKFKDRSVYEKDILLISNMYPNKKNPSFGVFVKNTKRILNGQGYSTEQIVIRKTNGKLKKIYVYIKHYICVIVKGTINNYKCIYVHYISHNAIPILILKRIKPNIKVCVNIHGSDINPRNKVEKILDKVTNNLLPLAESIIVPSEYYKNIVIEKYKINKEKVHVFPSGGVNSKIFYNKSIQKDKKYIGYVGRIESEKGWEVFLDCIRLLKENNEINNKSVIIVGNGKDSKKLNLRIKEYGLEDIIERKPLVSQSELNNLYNRMKIFCFPTKRESLGLVAIEAMACGVPVIGSDINPLKEYINHGENGYLFKCGDYMDLYDKVSNCLQIGKEKEMRLSENAIRTSQEYEALKVESKLKVIFENLIRQGK